MTILQMTLDWLEHPKNAGRECTLIVTTHATTLEGKLQGVSGDALCIAVYGSRGDGTTGPTGNDVLIPEREIRSIEIDWADTYGLVNGEESAAVALAERPARPLGRREGSHLHGVTPVIARGRNRD